MAAVHPVTSGPARVVPYAELVPRPWRNGGGWSRVVHASAADDDPEPDDDLGPDWRLSIARIDADGPFSTFPGVDRTLTVAGTAPLTLTVDRVRSTRSPGVVLTFPGEATVRAEVRRVGATVLNVMTRRGRSTASVRTIRLRDGAELRVTDAAAVVVLDGDAAVNGGPRLRALDSVVPGDADVTLHSEAALLAVVRIT